MIAPSALPITFNQVLLHLIMVEISRGHVGRGTDFKQVRTETARRAHLDFFHELFFVSESVIIKDKNILWSKKNKVVVNIKKSSIRSKFP